NTMGRSWAWLVPIEIPTMNAAAAMALPLNCDVTLSSLPLRTSPIAVTWNLSIGKSTRGPIGRVQARGGIDPARVGRSSAPGGSSSGGPWSIFRRPTFEGSYQEFSRPAGVEHQISFALPSTGHRLTRITLNRARGDLSERDRLMLNLVRPHVARAWEQAAAFERLAAERRGL